jgi:hypothetical protein
VQDKRIHHRRKHVREASLGQFIDRSFGLQRRQGCACGFVVSGTIDRFDVCWLDLGQCRDRRGPRCVARGSK